MRAISLLIRDYLNTRILPLALLTIIQCFSVSSYAQDNEWYSFTIQRVNLRISPTVRGELVTTLDSGLRILVRDETVNTIFERWMFVISDTDSGWIRDG